VFWHEQHERMTVANMAERDVLHEKIAQACARYGLLEGARGIVVGVSGGQDSVALLHALVSMGEFDLRVAAAHLHHGMRGEEADADQQYVRELCARLGAEFYAERRDIYAEAERSGLNVEEAGRRARYELLERVAAEGDFDRIATAHTGTDRAETLLLNMFRGAGVEGLRSIPPRRGKIVRPLILTTRQETGDYCERHGLEVRIDRTNLEADHARRNVLRLTVMPQIAEVFPGVERALLRVCEAIEEELAWTRPLMEDALREVTLQRDEERMALSLARLAELSPGKLHRVLRMAIEQVRGDLRDVSRERIERLARVVAEGETGKQVMLPGGWRARRGYNEIAIEPAPVEETFEKESSPLPVPGTARLERRGVEVRAELAPAPAQLNGADRLVALMNEAVAEGGLVLRSSWPGERFQPLGMAGTKKLQDFFVDEKAPPAERRRTPVVADTAGRILWVVGYRLSHPARVSGDGKRVVKLTARFD